MAVVVYLDEFDGLAATEGSDAVAILPGYPVASQTLNPGISPPVQAALVATDGVGSLHDGSYSYVVTALDAQGETAISNEQSATVYDGSGSPSALVATSTPGTGTVPDGTYFAVVTAVTASGESLPSNEATVIINTGGANNSSLVLTFAAAPGPQAVASYNAYVGTSAGGENLKFTGFVGSPITLASLVGVFGTPPVTDTSSDNKNEIAVSWSDPTGETGGFYVYRGTSPGNENVATFVAHGTLTLTDDGTPVFTPRTPPTANGTAQSAPFQPTTKFLEIHPVGGSISIAIGPNPSAVANHQVVEDGERLIRGVQVNAKHKFAFV